MRQRFAKLLLLAVFCLASTVGCSEKQQEKALPDIPDGGLKGFKFRSGTPKKPPAPP